ncbi:MAG: hypothetical protein F9K48_03305 [Candidatus Brocadia sp.]|nr:MAG: hypothetical protein F9K48_03305 [Candidatus Brocadia sp.]
MSKGKPEVLLVCSDGGYYNLLRIPSILSKAGCNVSLLTIRNNILIGSRFVHCLLPQVPDIPSLILSLKAHLDKNQNYYAWVILGDEGVLFELIKYRGAEWVEGWFPVDMKSELVDIISTKEGFARACSVRGIPFPVSYICDGVHSAYAIAEKAGYPVMLKTIRGSSGSGVRCAQNAQELITAYNSIKSPPKFILQNFIHGLVGVTEILMDHGTPLAWVSSYIYQTIDGRFGPSCVRQFMVHASMEKINLQLGEMTKFHGLCGFDWIHNQQDDSITVLEFHARPPPGFHLGVVCNVNFSDAIRDMLLGIRTVRKPIDPSTTGKHKRAYMFPQHVSRCIKERDFKDLIHWIPRIKSNCYYDILLNDLSLLKRIIFHSFFSKLTKLCQ